MVNSVESAVKINFRRPNADGTAFFAFGKSVSTSLRRIRGANVQLGAHYNLASQPEVVAKVFLKKALLEILWRRGFVIVVSNVTGSERLLAGGRFKIKGNAGFWASELETKGRIKLIAELGTCLGMPGKITDVTHLFPEKRLDGKKVDFVLAFEVEK